MKTLVKLLLLAALVGGAWYGVQVMRSEMAFRAGRHRVEAWLINAARGDSQGSLCQWAEGAIALDVDEMAPYVTPYDDFSRRIGLRSGSRWSIENAELLADGATVIVEVSIDGSGYDFVVTPKVPIELSE